MTKDYVKSVLRNIEYDKAMEVEKRTEVIPSIKFPSNWEVQIIPPFWWALVRFRVNDRISVYLDWYDYLWCYWEPYREVYPYDWDVFRCDMADVKWLLKAIKLTLSSNKTND